MVFMLLLYHFLIYINSERDTVNFYSYFVQTLLSFSLSFFFLAKSKAVMGNEDQIQLKLLTGHTSHNHVRQWQLSPLESPPSLF